jgi:HD-like signal output (HDOD) protein/CheY-like chemotaxis protein
VETATSAAQALQRLELLPFDALVTDARMPGMDGAQLLRIARERWPEMLRVVLSGDVGKDGPAAVTELAHQFIPKPISVPRLHARIEEALAARQLLGSHALKALVCRLGTLPTLPGTFAAINRLIEQPDASLEEFVRVVEHDPSVCANVLRVVNSAWFGLSTRIDSVREAVRLLGVRPLRNVVLAAEVFNGQGPEVERLRHAALERLFALSALVPRLQATEWKEAAATGVILADVGQLLLILRAPDEVEAIEREVAQGHARTDVEVARLGTDHAHLGAALLSMWSLPADLVGAVALHHEPRTAPQVRSLSTLLALICTLQDYQAATGARREALAQRALQLAEPFEIAELATLTSAFPGAGEAT